MRNCSATTRQGKRCKQQAILGAAVCRMHGGSAPQVKLAAKERIAAMMPTAMDVIEAALKEAMKTPIEGSRVAFNLMDRGGHGPSSTVTVKDDIADRLVSARKRLAEHHAATAPDAGVADGD